MEKESENSQKSPKQYAFKLPREFAVKWLQALRSGDYIQGNEWLAQQLDFEKYSYCCLGVGVRLCGVEPETLDCYQMPGEGFSRKEAEELGFPIELLAPKKWDFPMILANLNDGLNSKNLRQIVDRYGDVIVFKKLPDLSGAENSSQNYVHYSFSEIADWIEDNVEFY